LIEDLASDDFDERDKAENALIEFGAGARRPLQDARKKSKDPEQRKGAERCLKAIGKNSAADVLAAAARVLAHHKPAGTVEALLAYVPSADERDVVDEVVRALSRSGVRDGKADPALVKALKDKLAAKRGAAGEVLARVGGGTYLTSVRKLLKDEDTQVRQRVGIALLDSRDKQALPVLIALLTQVSGEDRDEVEDRLSQIAGEKSPVPAADGSAEARAKHKAAWQKWYKDSGSKIDLAKIEMNPPIKGYTIVGMMALGKGGRRGWVQEGKVVELDKAGKVRWEIKGLSYPTFAKVVRHDRVLICEWNGQVSERTFKGEVKWKKTLVGQMLGAQRLRNGNTFFYTRSELMEVDRNGKEVRKMTRPYDVLSAHREKTGGTCILTTGGRFIRLDRSGKEVKSFGITGVYQIIGTNMQILPRGRVLVPLYSASKVAEYDAKGKEVWSASVQWPNSVRRLRNGQTLVASQSTRKVILLDKKGKEVWSKTMEGWVYYADRR
jgi:hypothetical protein